MRNKLCNSLNQNLSLSLICFVAIGFVILLSKIGIESITTFTTTSHFTKHYILKDSEYDMLPSGSPTVDAYDKLLKNPVYKEWTEVYSNKFLKDNKDILVGYTQKWVADPLHTWSRGWEYTYVAAAIRKYAPRDRDLYLLDFGSGVTFVDWMIAYEILDNNPRSRVLAADNNMAYQDWFDQLNKRYMERAKQGDLPEKYRIPKVQFIGHDIRKPIPILNTSIDIAFCISVMEHVDDSLAAARNIYNTLVPGGYLIITFDIDRNSAIVNHNPLRADALLKELRRIGREIHFDNSVLRTYNNEMFQDMIQKKNDLYTLYDGKIKQYDDSEWINTKSESIRKGLFFSCHIFQKL
ncbi:unnamed protein product [Adineta steineri]|uniref:Methyltransferase type 11 domain-containing protein n=1 Tax=Adineta steineri TaxID=433720 RepID=A0A814DZ31_9BILA|nr:unnamed protein product [Adineta steineri]CAF3794150.1 unnamed protein product [Adineta steineri]